MFLLCVVSLKAQQASSVKTNTGQLNGLVQDKDNRQPIEYATIELYKISNIKPINGTTTNSKGEFSIKGLDSGIYYIQIEFIGYSSLKKNNIIIDSKNVKFNLGNILLQKSQTDLKEVVVTSSQRLIENKIDKMVFNAEKDISSQNGVATDILKKIPQVSVDIDGNVQLSGTSSIRFLINGRPSTSYGTNISEVLQSIPASEIKSIEVLTNPGAKYDANGLGGIINIILKSNKAKGYNGTINTSIGSRIENGSLNLSARKNSLGVNFNVSGNERLLAKTPSTLEKTTIDSANHQFHYLSQDGSSQFQRGGYHAGFNLDWSPNKKNSFSVNLGRNNFGNDASGYNNQILTSQLFSGGNIIPNNLLHNTTGITSDVKGYDYGASYKRNFNKEDRELEVKFNSSYNKSYIYSTSVQNDQTSNAIIYGSQNTNNASNKESEFAIDYSEPITKNIKWNSGTKYIDIQTNSATDVMRLQNNGLYLRNNSLSNSLQYHQQVMALYTEISAPLSSTIDMKIGGRYERTIVDAEYSSTTQNVNRDYFNVVPSIFFMKRITDDDNFKLSYSRRINRPGYDELNPYFNTTDPKNITTGNPLLLPEHGERIEFAYNKKLGSVGDISFSVFQRNSDQDIQPYTFYYSSIKIGDTTFNNVSISSPNNIGLEKNTGVNLFTDVHVFKSLDIRSNFSFYHRDIYNSIDKNYNAHSENYRINMNATYEFSKTFIMEGFGNFSSARNEVQGKYPSNVNYSLALKKRFWNNKGSFGFVAINPFAEYIKQQVLISGSNFNSNSIRYVPSRSFGISFSWKFGKLEFKKERKEQEFGQEENN
jgi:outer membrane receptor protein involved in Fe transport